MVISHLVQLVHVDSRCCYQLFHNLQVAVPVQSAYSLYQADRIAIVVKDHMQHPLLDMLTRLPTLEQSSRRTPSR